MNKDRFKFRVWNEKFKVFHFWGFINGAFIGPKHPSRPGEQCTGLKDKNGRLIYEGDIISLINTKEKYFVKWHFNRFVFKWRRISEIDRLSISAGWFEIIGNIHENPKLLQDGE